MMLAGMLLDLNILNCTAHASKLRRKNCLGCMMLAGMLLDLNILNSTAHASDINNFSLSPGPLMFYFVFNVVAVLIENL